MKALSFSGGVRLDNIVAVLKDTMKRRGITREELAALTGIPEANLATIELNSSEANVADLQKISNALNISFHIGDTSI